jgi:hypothetical protein
VGFGGATVTGTKTLSAAWNGVQYRIGEAPTVPAATADSSVTLSSGNSGWVNEATDSRTGDVFGGWFRFFSKPASEDGVYLADFSKKSAPLKVPGSGSLSSSHLVERLPIASPRAGGGIYAALCFNTSPCGKIELWRYGSKHVEAVPNSSGAETLTLSAGPAGRLWVAWWNSTLGRMYTVRTNEADNAFGPVESYAGPAGCTGDGGGTIAISGGSSQRLDVVVTCVNYNRGAIIHAQATQSLTALSITESTATISHKKGGSVSYVIKDAGDPVHGVAVAVDGRQGKTNKAGRVTFKFSKGSKTGTFRVTATMVDYYGASSTLRIN